MCFYFCSMLYIVCFVLYCGLTSKLTVFQSCQDRTTDSRVLISSVGSKCLAKGQNPGPLDSESDALPPGPEVIKLFSCSAQLSIKFELLINTEIGQIN